jgi:hypothetical protein
MRPVLAERDATPPLTRCAEYCLILPLRFNSGEQVPTAIRQRIEGILLDRFDGFSADRDIDGAWRGPDGRVYNDRHDEYRLAASNAADVLAVAREIGDLLDQHAIYVRYPNNRVEIVRIEAPPT